MKNNVVLRPKEGQLAIRAYCSKCGKLLMESRRLTKKQLHSVWDRSVIQAVQFKCADCGTKFPNFEIDLRIVNLKINKEYDPQVYIKAPHKEDPVQLFRHISEQWIKEHPDVKLPTKKEILEAVLKQREYQRRIKNGQE